MIASLPMYDRPELQAANNRLWTALRDHLGEGPKSLTRDDKVWDHWTASDLVLSQTCGFPYRARLHGKVQLVGTPDNRLKGCAPGEYYSVFVARADDPREHVQQFATTAFAYNDPLSQSGWAAPATYAQNRGFAFEAGIETGGHALSAKTVAEGEADLAALDALSWRLIKRYDSFAAHLRVIARTDPTPTLPYITSLNRHAAPLRAALTHAIQQISAQDRDTLSLYAVVDMPATRYLDVPTPAPPRA